MTTGTGSLNAGDPTAPGSWTIRLRSRIEGLVPPGQALPDRQPAYVASWIYVFGVLTLAALAVVIVSGGVLSLGGAAWYHVSSLGLYVNSVHLWSVELFFGFMVIHLWGKFWMAAWRGGRALTWITGVVLFGASIGTAFTGYLSQSNFDSQWISAEGKDGLNSVGIGAWFNVLNPGQMLLWHVVLLPFAVGVITVLHVVLVRRAGCGRLLTRREIDHDVGLGEGRTRRSDYHSGRRARRSQQPEPVAIRRRSPRLTTARCRSCQPVS